MAPDKHHQINTNSTVQLMPAVLCQNYLDNLWPPQNDSGKLMMQGKTIISVRRLYSV